MAITRLLASDVKTVMGVVTLGLLTWAHYVAMVMADAGMDEGEESGGVAEETEGVAEGGRVGGEVQLVQRTQAWQKKTAGNLSLLVERLCVLVTSDAWKVRLYMVGWSHTLLTHCST